MKTKHTLTALLAALAVIAGAVGVTGCGNDDTSSSSSPAKAASASDVAFINDMTSHHQGAIDMANVAETKAEHPQIKAMAAGIIAAQKAEIATMRTLRNDMREMGMHQDGHMGMSDAEMGMDMNMSDLEKAKPFDQAFMDAMIPHHQGAITMARQLLKDGKSPELQAMANNIIQAQAAEIAQMRQWQKQWYSPSGQNDSGGSSDMGMLDG